MPKNMNIESKPVFLEGRLHQISEPAGISYFPGNIITVATSKNKDSLLKENALSIDEILNGMYEEGYYTLTAEDILSLSTKYRFIHYNFFITLCRKVYEILQVKVPEITVKKYFDAIGKEVATFKRHQTLSLFRNKFSSLGENIDGTTFLQGLKNYIQGFIDLNKAQIIKNPRLVYKNLNFYNFTMNFTKVVVHESDKDIENHQIDIEYVILKDLKKFDYFNEFNIQHAKTILKWIPLNCGCQLSSVWFSIKNENPFYTVKYFPETFSLKKDVAVLRKDIKTYDQILIEQIQKEIEINQTDDLLDEKFHKVFSLQSQLNKFLSEIPENERAKRLYSIMKSILHDWDKYIKNIEYFAIKLEEGLKNFQLSLASFDDSNYHCSPEVNEKLANYIKLANYTIFEVKNLNKTIDGIRNYNDFKNTYEKVNINKLIKTVFEIEKHKIWKYKNNLLLTPETEEVLIEANSYQINNMIINLLDNAVSHGDIKHPEFYINLHVSRDGDYLKILIENTGGISKRTYEYLTNACEKRERFTTSEKGEGQGLKNVIEIINNHNGKYLIPYNEEKFIFIAYLPIVDFN